jgi:hypothetical protein
MPGQPTYTRAKSGLRSITTPGGSAHAGRTVRQTKIPQAAMALMRMRLMVLFSQLKL